MDDLPATPALTVLLAEDEPDMRELVRMRLEHAGFTVLAAPDGAEALRLWQDTATLPALVFTDWSMPVVDGLELARRIRADPRGVNVPIVLFTAYTPGTEREELEVLKVHYRSKTDRWHEIEPLLIQLTSANPRAPS